MNEKFTLTETEAASYLGLSRQTLANWRFQGRGPCYLKLKDSRAVRYRLSDLIAYQEKSVIEPRREARP